MKVAHFSTWGRRQSGLYECTKDQIKYERRLGIDAVCGLFESETPDPSLVDDGWFKPVSWDQCKDADLYVIHRGLPGALDDKKKKTVMIIHGTVEFLMLEEVNSHAEKTPFNTHINLIRDCSASVAVNPHDFDIYKLYDAEGKLSMIHDAIDTERFTIDGYAHPYNNHPQILYCDSLRANKHPAHAFWAMAEVVKKIPSARISIIGLDLSSILTWRNLILRSPGGKLAENIENLQLISPEVRPYMRGADILINGNMSGVPSRVSLEAMASGCSVVSYAGDFSKWHPKPFDVKDIAAKVVDCWEHIKKDPKKARQEARQWVLKNANMEEQVKTKYIPLYEKLVGAR